MDILSQAASNDPLLHTALAAYECINTVEKVEHYSEIAEKKGTAAAAGEFVKDAAKQTVKNYATDAVTTAVVGSGLMNETQRSMVEDIVGAVVDYGVDKAEEAFLNG